MRLPKPLEKDVLAACRDCLTLAGCFVVRVNSGRMPWTDAAGRRRSMAMNSQPGCSDLLAVLPDGRFLAVETKRPGGKPTPLQVAFLGEVTRRGGLALVVDSLESLRAALALEGYEV